MKICSYCKEPKPEADFYWVEKRRRHQAHCKRCNYILSTKYTSKPERTKQVWRNSLKRKYNLTEEAVIEMLRKQGGGCYLCMTSISFDDKSVHIDHCHKTGKVRGLLCKLCNCGLGYFRDDPKLMLAAITYLGGLDGISRLA